MKVLVCGGRDYRSYGRVCEALNTIHNGHSPITRIVHGGAKGADTLAGMWAAYHGIHTMVYPANWGRDGKAAGLIRNQRMLDEEDIDLVVAFPGGRGTAHMVNIARKGFYNVVEID